MRNIKNEVKENGGYWERECLKCGDKDEDGEMGMTGGYGGGKNGETVHTSRTKGVPDCRGKIKEIWHTEAEFEFEQANSLLRSAYAIALREGKDTNWEAWRNQLLKELKRQHKIMYPGNTFNGETL